MHPVRSYSTVVSAPPVGALAPLALLRWHETGRRAHPASSDLLDWPGADVVRWLQLPHTALIRCPELGWCEARLGSDDALELPAHRGWTREHQQLVDVLGAGAEAGVPVWPWDGDDRRLWRDALDPHAAALVVVARLRRWRGVIAPPEQPRQALCWGALPGQDLPRPPREPAPEQRPPDLGHGWPTGPWLRERRDEVLESARERRACAICWTYGVHHAHGDLCARCRAVLLAGWDDDPQAALAAASVLQAALPSLSAAAAEDHAEPETLLALDRLRLAVGSPVSVAPLLAGEER